MSNVLGGSRLLRNNRGSEHLRREPELWIEANQRENGRVRLVWLLCIVADGCCDGNKAAGDQQQRPESPRLNRRLRRSMNRGETA